MHNRSGLQLALQDLLSIHLVLGRACPFVGAEEAESLQALQVAKVSQKLCCFGNTCDVVCSSTRSVVRQFWPRHRILPVARRGEEPY